MKKVLTYINETRICDYKKSINTNFQKSICDSNFATDPDRRKRGD